MTTQYDPSRIAIAIPARMESKRLPGKPLVEVGGKPLLWWAWQAASACKEVGVKFVVTDSKEIEEFCWGGKIPCFVSKRKHPTGTDRIAEIFAEPLGVSFRHLTHVINLQCDEPDITGEDLDWMARRLSECHDDRVITFSAPLPLGDWHNRNATKVVVDCCGQALYFSREPLHTGSLHVGIYGMSVGVLEKFSLAKQSPMEICERLEQLRFLYHGVRIRVIHLNRPIRSINTLEDVEQWSAVST